MREGYTELVSPAGLVVVKDLDVEKRLQQEGWRRKGSIQTVTVVEEEDEDDEKED